MTEDVSLKILERQIVRLEEDIKYNEDDIEKLEEAKRVKDLALNFKVAFMPDRKVIIDRQDLNILQRLRRKEVIKLQVKIAEAKQKIKKGQEVLAW